MHWTQALFIVLLAAAFYTGRPPLRVMAVMMTNLLGTMTLATTPLAVGVLDLGCAAALAFGSRREAVLCLLFLLMVPIYALDLYFSWPSSTTYAIIDLIAYVQVWVIGNFGGIWRNVRRRGADRLGPDPVGSEGSIWEPTGYLARIVAPRSR